MSRRFGALVLAIVAATGLLASPAGSGEVRAAAPGLSIVTDARYDVEPAEKRVRVTVDMVLKNRLKDTSTRRYYYDHAFLAVQPGASAPKFTRQGSGSGSPKARITKATSAATTVRLDLGSRLYSGKSAKYRLVFDIVDTGGEATRQVRVGDSLVTFPVWAFASGSTSGSTARVVFPAGYRVDVASGDMPAATTAADGTVVLQTERLESPLTFFAFLVADRVGTTIDRTVEASVGGTTVPLTISAWSDDVAWADRVGDLAARALPILAERTGLGWARDGGLAIRETIGRSSGGYAGLFDPATGEIEVAYDASDEVVLHEAAHSWFNGSLLADRWANEAFASYYARAAAPDLEVTVAAADTDTLTPELEVARIPLNAWGALGAEARATEDYGYAASLILARTIGERVGDDGLKAVWAAAASRIGAYQPSAAGGTDGSAQAPETVDAPPDWRGLLDLLDEHATTSLDDAWRTWVARDDDLALLDARRAARSRYAAVVASAGDWPLPRPLRDAMRAWQFDDANRLMTAAEALVAQRATITARASASGLTLPETLRTAFAGPDGFTAAANEAAAELEAIDQYDAAVAARAPSTDLFEDIGLWGTSPSADLDAARTLFAAGDLSGAATSAANAASAWSNAADTGRGRVISLGLLLLAAIVVVVLATAWYRGRRRAARGTMTAGDIGA